MKRSGFIYDSRADSLVVFREDRKAHSHLDLGEVIIGMDKSLRIVSVEILNPDKIYKIPKKKLASLSSAFLQSQCRGSILWVYLLLEFPNKEKEKLPLSIPLSRLITC